MNKGKIIKTMMLSIGIVIFSSSLVLASPDQDKQDINKSYQPVVVTATTGSPEMTVTSIDSKVNPVSEEVLKKQKEIDQILFEENNGEFKEQGFKVTHTSPQNGYVEVGITPYNNENVEFLYHLLGRDMVKIVEGQQAILFGNDSAVDVKAISAPVQKMEDTNTPSFHTYLIYSGGFIILVGLLIIGFRRKTVKK